LIAFKTFTTYVTATISNNCGNPGSKMLKFVLMGNENKIILPINDNNNKNKEITNKTFHNPSFEKK
jgi:hypothetical protein